MIALCRIVPLYIYIYRILYTKIVPTSRRRFHNKKQMEYLKENTIKKKDTKRVSITAKVLIAATGGIGLGLTVVCASFVAPAFRRYCLPYVPATTEQVNNVLSFIPKNSKGKLLDIGSGDGRIVIAAAKHGVKSEGVELNPWLVLYSQYSALKHGVHKMTSFFRRDLWKFNLQPYNYIVIFGVEQMMKDLEHKLIAESQRDCKIIACRFPLPSSKPTKVIEDGVNTVWFYEIPKKSLD